MPINIFYSSISPFFEDRGAFAPACKCACISTGAAVRSAAATYAGATRPDAAIHAAASHSTAAPSTVLDSISDAFEP